MKRPASPSRSPEAAKNLSAARRSRNTGRARSAPEPRSAIPRGRVDVREWGSGIRLSGFMVIMLSLVILGVWVLVPTVGTLVEQRQRISAVEQSVLVSEAEIAELEAARSRWDDPAFITTQARERLYFFKPGQTGYLIQNDLDPTSLPPEPGPVSDTIQEQAADWGPHLLRSLVGAGMAEMAATVP